ncbi:hypothetical protein COCMIDRAFT_3878 [Bipolaris oryzae ATCC 44560]|uniref:Uncharacterized protein n=1 Tax=Bipolaris oryzae ATCC 44560 TaxID=930090 RepID=W6Z623_COCMI|nr:uncharacterized protein COCMIDRAFT_3878 [Bipolaris oryzae ATCC 44560]EUC47172.1 hypothetical protein COCMIDRAFT_3878 [Bipolaris oryzae ATCC 44560]
MVNTSHSRSVRGTLSRPSSSSSSSSSQKPPPSLSDATSLTPENASLPLPPHDSAPPPSTPSSPSASDSASPEAPTPSTPYHTLGTAAGGGDKRAVGNRAAGTSACDFTQGAARDSTDASPDTTAKHTAGNATVKEEGERRLEGKGKGEEEEEPHSRQVRGTLGNKKPEGRVEKTMLGDPASLVVERKEGVGEKMDAGTEREGVEKGMGKRESKL